MSAGGGKYGGKPCRLEVSTLENSHSNTFFCCNLEPVRVHGCPSLRHLYTLQGAKAHMKDHQGKHTIAFTPTALTNDAPWVSDTCQSTCLNHVGVTTMERLDQGHLYPSLNRGPKTDMSQLGIEPGWRRALLKSSIRTAYFVAIWKLCTLLPQCMARVHSTRSKSSYVRLSE
jgi:hypothetical protein